MVAMARNPDVLAEVVGRVLAAGATAFEVEYKDGSTMKVESKGPQPEEPQQPQQPPPPPAVDLPSLGSPELTGQGAPEPGKAGPDMNQVPSLR